jgi:hypothetical protein
LGWISDLKKQGYDQTRKVYGLVEREREWRKRPNSGKAQIQGG